MSIQSKKIKKSLVFSPVDLNTLVSPEDGELALDQSDGVLKQYRDGNWEEVGSGSGGGEWGTITGDIEDQTDLKNALDSKVEGPVTAANNAIPRFDGTTGKIIKLGSATINDAGRIISNGISLSSRISFPSLTYNGTGSNVSISVTDVSLVYLNNAGLQSISALSTLGTSILTLFNNTGHDVTLVHEDTDFPTNARIWLTDQKDFVLQHGKAIELVGLGGRWRVQGSTDSHALSNLQYGNDRVLNSDGEWRYASRGSLLPNPDFEKDDTGWIVTASVASIGRTTSAPLSGIASGAIGKGASNAQGDTFDAPFTIEPKDKFSNINISFPYINTGSYVTGDIAVQILDDSNEVIKDIPLPASLVETYFYGSFQATSDLNYTFRLIIKTTSALAYSLRFDDVSICSGLKTTVNSYTGVYTPVISNEVNTTGLSVGPATYVVTGDTVTVYIAYSHNVTSASGDVTTFEMSIPFVRSGNFNASGDAMGGGGSSRAQSIGGVSGFTVIAVGGTQRVRVRTNGFANATLNYSGSFSYKLDAAAESLSGLYDNRPIEFIAHLSSNFSLATSGEYYSVPNANLNIVRDTTSGWNGVDGWVAPATDTYEIFFQGSFGLSATGNRSLAFTINGGSEIQLAAANGIASNATTLNASNLIRLNAGDVVRWRAWQSSGGALNLATAGGTVLSIIRKNTVLAAGGKQKLYIKANSPTGGQTISTDSVMIYENIVESTHPSYNTSTGVFTAPFDGRFTFNAGNAVASLNLSTVQRINLLLNVNTENLTIDYLPGTGASRSFSVAGGVTVVLKAGQQVYVVANSNVSATTTSSVNNNYLIISGESL